MLKREAMIVKSTYREMNKSVRVTEQFYVDMDIQKHNKSNMMKLMRRALVLIVMAVCSMANSWGAITEIFLNTADNIIYFKCDNNDLDGVTSINFSNGTQLSGVTNDNDADGDGWYEISYTGVGGNPALDPDLASIIYAQGGSGGRVTINPNTTINLLKSFI